MLSKNVLSIILVPLTNDQCIESTRNLLYFTYVGTQNSIPIGVKNNHPVKRRGVASVTKCTKCNGSGIIFIGGSKNQQNNVDKPFHCNICNGKFLLLELLNSIHSFEKQQSMENI